MKKSILICALLASACFGLRADLNGDGTVNFQDFAIFAAEWNMSEPNDTKYVVSGILSPDAAGDYFYAGVVGDNNDKIYSRSDNAFTLIEDVFNNNCEIYSGVFGQQETLWHMEGNIGLIGDYEPVNESVTGTATVSAVPLSYRVYRGQDGVIDYNNVVGRMWPGDTSVSLANQDLPPNTIWHYVRRSVSECGLESADSPPCIVVIDSDGEMIGNTPNTPANLKIEQVIGGKLRLRWRYIPTGQDIIPTGFNIYMDDGSGFNFDTPIATIPYKRAIEHSWTSEALTHGQRYKFIVRSYAGSVARDCYRVTAKPGETLVPDSAGDYYYAGLSEIYNNRPTYLRTDGLFLLVDEVLNNFITMVSGNSLWLKDTDGLTGEYNAQYESSGTAVATFMTLTSYTGYSSNTDYVSAVADAEGPAAATGVTLSWEADD